eukprot:CAMPEP_0113669530 /NCGR_PEP_ID=MMETSP0038_2-20120614/4621_1 /TAXON_ID=2898 /ORGANISM="Cryptomonas paramecium" /LENGTH=142 /DNA_ID=CAMNT_0000585423 /DNA_START=53 /DNA_END=481 /DNA_ORIENTATION=- /assembly_acc=CAM_ASM_000170
MRQVEPEAEAAYQGGETSEIEVGGESCICDLDDFGLHLDDAILELQSAQVQLDETIRQLRFTEAHLGCSISKIQSEKTCSAKGSGGLSKAKTQRDEAFRELKTAEQELNEALRERDEAIRQRDCALQRERELKTRALQRSSS